MVLDQGQGMWNADFLPWMTSFSVIMIIKSVSNSISYNGAIFRRALLPGETKEFSPATHVSRRWWMPSGIDNLFLLDFLSHYFCFLICLFSKFVFILFLSSFFLSLLRWCNCFIYLLSIYLYKLFISFLLIYLHVLDRF